MAVSALSYEIADSDGEIGRAIVYFDSTGLTLAQIQTFSDALAIAMSDVIDGSMLGVKLQLELTVPLAAVNAAGVNIEKEVGASFSFVNSADRRDTMFVPTFKKALMSDGAVTLTHADVIAFTDLIVTGNGTLTPTDTNGLDITGVSRAFETTRKRRA